MRLLRGTDGVSTFHRAEPATYIFVFGKKC